MSIFNYFKKVASNVVEDCIEEELPNITIREREEIVVSLQDLEERGKSRGKYKIWSGDEKKEIGNYAIKHGVSKTVRELSKKYPGLKKQTVSDHKKMVEKGDTDLSNKKRGRKALLPDEFMNKTIDVIKGLRLRGALVSAAIINSVATGVIMANDRTILVENGGYLSLNHQWGRNVLYRLDKEGKKMCQRKGTTAKIPIAPGILKEEKLKFQRDIKTLQQQHNIPDELILNHDQTPLSYVCAPSRTLHTKGETSVPLIGKGKKKQITGTFTVTKTGEFLPMQIIYEGKTVRCHPQGIKFPEGFNITHTPKSLE